MELSPEHLYAAARRWDGWADGVVEAGATLHGAPLTALGPAAGEAGLLLDAVSEALSRLAADAERLVDGLLLSARVVSDADDQVAAALAGRVPGAGR